MNFFNLRKNSIIVFILFFSFVRTYSQKVDSDSLVNAMKKDATDFFINKKVLNKNIVKDNLSYVLINEINKKKVVGFDKIGIYSIGVFQSHSEKHILIKENSKYKIFDIQHIDLVLKEIIDFSSRNNLTKNEMLLYVKNIVQIYDDNFNHEYTSIEKKKE